MWRVASKVAVLCGLMAVFCACHSSTLGDGPAPRGLDSLRSVSQIAPIGSRGQLEVPFAGAERSDDLFTMGRVLGHVWLGGKDVSALQVSSGHATAAK